MLDVRTCSFLLTERAVAGSGVRRSELLVPGRLLTLLPGAEAVEGLAS